MTCAHQRDDGCVLFETRYFWAVFTSKDPETTKKLKVIFEKAKTAFASSISIYEIYKQTIEHDDKAVAQLRTRTISNEYTIVDVSAEIAEEAARISHRLRIPMADSLIMATSKSLRVSCVTDDPHFTEVKRVWIR
jgi:predicted nucleic acid-binding protein